MRKIFNFQFSIFNSRSGFTLIELLIVIAITFVIGIVAVPFYSRFFTQNAVSNTTDQLTAELRKAQMYAMMGKQNGTWGVNYGSNVITLFQGSSYAGRNTAFDEKFNVDNGSSIGGFTSVTFSRGTGTPSATQSITIIGNTTSKIITVNVQGAVNK
jgi:prepilin-type N-terminal cleavage/methylation domain-containing protein